MSGRGDPYLDPLHRVLRNRLGLVDRRALLEAEQFLSLTRADELATGKVDLGDRCDLEHFKAIHRHLFQDVFEWAGETRDVRGFTGFKSEDLLGEGISVEYPAHDGRDPDDHLASRLDYAFSRLAKDQVLRDPTTSGERYVERLAHQVTEVWECPAFREGNTRTTALFGMARARALGRPLDRSLLIRTGASATRSCSPPAGTSTVRFGRCSPTGSRGASPGAGGGHRRARSSSSSRVSLPTSNAPGRRSSARRRAGSSVSSRCSSIMSSSSSGRRRRRGGRCRPTSGRNRVGDDRDRRAHERRGDGSATAWSRRPVSRRGTRGRRASSSVDGGARLAKAFDTVRRVHRELVVLVDERERATDPREAEHYDRRISELATTLAKQAEHRMALDPVARRFARYEQARSGRAMARVRARERDPPDRSR